MGVEKNDKKSLVMIVTAMVIYGTIGIFRRYIPLPSAVLAFWRGIIGSSFLLAFVKLRGRVFWHRIERIKIVGLIVTGAMIGINWILLFEAYNYTTVATATLCYYMQPTILILITPIFFKDKMTIKKATCALTGIVGMIFVSGVIENGMPTIGEVKGIVYGIGAAALYAGVIVMNKKLAGIDAYQKTIVELFFAAIVLMPYLLLGSKNMTYTLDARAIVMIAIVGLVHTGIAYALYFGSMDGLKTQSIALLSYIDPVTALILSAVILHERLTVYGIIGAVLILAAAIYGEMTPENGV